jgi:tRNA(adenine34) deaminase
MPSPDPQPSDLDLAMMRRALDLARTAAALHEVPVGAVVYRTATGEVLGEGFNRRELDNDPAAHAEMLAVRAAAMRLGDWRLNDCSLAVTLEPCPMCAGLIVNARVGRVLYGPADPKAGATRTLFSIADDARLNHRAVVVPGVLADEGASLLREFFRARR